MKSLSKKEIVEIFKLVGSGFVLIKMDEGSDETQLIAHHVSLSDMMSADMHLKKVILGEIAEMTDEPKKKSSPKKKVAKKAVKKVTKK